MTFSAVSIYDLLNIYRNDARITASGFSLFNIRYWRILEDDRALTFFFTSQAVRTSLVDKMFTKIDFM
jgi:hypothetical protein